MSSGNPGTKRISPGLNSNGWDFHSASSIAAEHAPEVKNATVGISSFLKTSFDQVIMTSTTAQTGLVGRW
jgi:hypothetical protein